jgi:DNA helicase-2/ATP-dependent DNA helicase PcrA
MARPRHILRDLLRDFDRWAAAVETTPHDELAQTILEESGLIDMWKAERTADAEGRLENLKELTRSMGEFPSLAAFLEHVSLVMEAESGDGEDRVSIMTLHAAKGLEFDIVFLPGWEEGLFPHQRALDESGRAGLEEERRLAYVGLTRARRAAKIYFAANRRVHGLWQSSAPSRFIDELPADHVEVVEAQGGPEVFAGSRFDREPAFASRYETPGWRRAQANGGEANAAHGTKASPRVIEGRVIARETPSASFAVGARVFHIKFGNGDVVAVDGPKLTVEFDRAGRKMVLDSFVSAVG